jgi:hypothetical protein
MRSVVAAAFIAASLPGAALAVEGGSGAYLLGARDTMAGFVPPPGTYINNDFVFINGSAPTLSISGAIVSEPEISAFVYKLNATQVFDGKIFGASPAININIPYAAVDMDFSPVLLGTIGRPASDSQSSFSDIVITPMLGWHSPHWHYSLSLSFYLPTGQYSDAVIRPLQGEFDIVSTGKNKFAFDPTFSATYLNPKSGFEISAAVGLTINAKNDATDYQTAPEFHVEFAVAQHLPSGLTLGVAGYGYQQLGDDSGSGAESLRAAIGAKSLEAQVYGIGPVIAYNTKLGSVGVNLAANYFYEFGARRRFESDVFWLTAGLSF